MKSNEKAMKSNEKQVSQLSLNCLQLCNQSLAVACLHIFSQPFILAIAASCGLMERIKRTLL